MGYMMLTALCWACGKLFTSNPELVPSFKGDPICETCMVRVNIEREANGLDEWPVHPDAYEPQEI